jgi:putative transposase
MTHQTQTNAFENLLELLVEHGFDRMAEAMTILLNEAMKLERTKVLGAAPYERSEHRVGYANGYKQKTVASRFGKMTLDVPQTRDSEFYPTALERGERSERALKLALAEMYVQGVSTRKVAAITEELCGFEVSSSQVSRATALLDEELQQWRTRELGDVPFILLDARYEKVRYGGCVVDCSLLIAIGIKADGTRTVLGVSVSLSEAEVHWRSFLESLQERGLHAAQLIVSDDHAGLGAARRARFAGVPWQRCQFHLQQNAAHYVPRLDMRKQVADDIRSIFNATDRRAAEERLKTLIQQYQESAPDLADWMETNLPEGLTIFDFPPKIRRRLRTTNLLERINKELKRRTRVATLFPNPDSLLRLASAVLMEISEEWETGRAYINLETT